MKKKNILIGATSLVGAGLVGSAIAVPVVTSQNQSSSVDSTDPSVSPTPPTDPSTPIDPSTPSTPTDPVDPTPPTDPSTPTDPVDPTPPTDPSTPTDPVDPTPPTDPSTPTDPVDPIPAEKLAVVPQVDEFYSVTAVNYSTLIKSSDDLNKTLEIIFDTYQSPLVTYANNGQNNAFIKDSESYSNVTLSFVKDSGVYSAIGYPTFKMLATPVAGTTWSDGTNTPKSIDFTWIVANGATAPASDTFNFDVAVNHSASVSDDEALNSQLKSMFANGISSYSDYFTNWKSYKNVSFSYVDGSASYANKSFQLKLTPVDSAVWGDKTNASKTITVSLAKLSYKNSSTANSTAVYSDTIQGVSNTSQLLSYLKQNLDISKLKNLNATNVDVYLDESSVNYDNTTFRVFVTPTAGHAWSDGSVTGRPVTVSFVNAIKISYAPTEWSMDSIISQTFNADYWKQVNDGTVDFDELGQLAVNSDMANYAFKKIEYVQGSAKFIQTLDVNWGKVTNFTIQVAPPAGYTWDDATTSVRTIQVHIFTTAYLGLSPTIQLSPANTKDEFVSGLESGTSKSEWVSNFIASTLDLSKSTFAENQAILKDKVLADLKATFADTDFDINITDPVSLGYGGYNYFDTWTYKVSFLSKVTGEGFTIPGYVFTDNYVANGIPGGFDEYISSVPYIFLKSNTAQSATYRQDGLVVDPSCPYGYTTYWGYSFDGGKTWGIVSKNNPSVSGLTYNDDGSITVSKVAGRTVTLRYVVNFGSNGSNFVYVASDFVALNN